jgi:hypothetical protein
MPIEIRKPAFGGILTTEFKAETQRAMNVTFKTLAQRLADHVDQQVSRSVDTANSLTDTESAS